MFKKNDKTLLAARVILIVVITIFAVLSLAMGIVLAIQVHTAMILTTFVGWFFCWLLWIFARLYLSYLCDVKLIRNKLYEESNEYLEKFWKYEKKVSVRFNPEKELARLDELLASGEISSEEYEKLKKDLQEES